MYRRRQQRGPIPFAISVEVAFIRDGLTDEDYEREVRAIIRKHLPTAEGDRRDRDRAGWFEEYDERVSEMIEEELAKN